MHRDRLKQRLKHVETTDVFAPSMWAKLPEFRCYTTLLAAFTDDTWPNVDTYQQHLRTDVQFFVPEKKLKAGIDQSDIRGSYVDVTAAGRIPSRPRCLHDFFNALVWARFPKAKSAIARLHVAHAEKRIPIVDKQRTRDHAQDVLSMIDEGGALLCDGVISAVIGHAVLEDAARGRKSRPFLMQQTGSHVRRTSAFHGGSDGLVYDDDDHASDGDLVSAIETCFAEAVTDLAEDHALSSS